MLTTVGVKLESPWCKLALRMSEATSIWSGLTPLLTLLMSSLASYLEMWLLETVTVEDIGPVATLITVYSVLLISATISVRFVLFFCSFTINSRHHFSSIPERNGYSSVLSNSHREKNCHWINATWWERTRTFCWYFNRCICCVLSLRLRHLQDVGS